MRYHATINIEVDVKSETKAEELAEQAAQLLKERFRWAKIEVEVDDVEEA